MTKPDYYIVLPDGKKYITLTTAALMLNVHRRRVLQFIEEGALTAQRLPRSNIKITPLKEFLKFAQKPRTVGRPPKHKVARKAAKKA
jgi:hypothetical protein